MKKSQKIFICSDMEGVAGVAAWEEVNKESPDYEAYAIQMSKEVQAACEAVLSGSGNEVLVKDAHSSARNIKTEYIPKGAKIFKGWARNPYIMMAGLDETFDGVIMTGFHCGAATNGNPLAHTMNSETISKMTLNGMIMSEFVWNAYICGLFEVPIIAITGDDAICTQAKSMIAEITTIAVKKGLGNGVISVGNEESIEMIREGVALAMKKDFSKCLVKMPKEFTIEIRFIEHFLAYKASFYPGVEQIDDYTIRFVTQDFYEFLRLYFFIS